MIDGIQITIETAQELLTLYEREKSRAVKERERATTIRNREFFHGKADGLTDAIFYLRHHIETLNASKKENA